MKHLYFIFVLFLLGVCSQLLSPKRLTLFLNESNNTIIQEYCDSLIDKAFVEKDQMFLLITQKWTPLDTILTICSTTRPIMVDYDGPGEPLQYAFCYRGYLFLIVFMNQDSFPNVFCEMKHDRRAEAKLIKESHNVLTHTALKREHVRYFKINNGILESRNTPFPDNNDDSRGVFCDKR